MKESFSYIKRDRIVKRSFLFSSFLLFIALIYTFILYSYLPPVIPIYNQLPWGIERLGEKTTLFFPILLAAIILLINILFSQVLYKNMPLVVRMMSVTTLFVCTAMCIFILRITLLLLF